MEFECLLAMWVSTNFFLIKNSNRASNFKEDQLAKIISLLFLLLSKD